MVDILKKPIWRVPLVLSLTGILCRVLTYFISFVSVRIQMAQNRDMITGGYATGIIAMVSFILFWAAGWKFVRGISRRQIFLSATIMVVWEAALLAAEQISQAMGSYSMLVYRLYATTEATMWATQILVRVFDQVSVPVLLPGLLAPYLYLLFGKRQPDAVTEQVTEP